MNIFATEFNYANRLKNIKKLMKEMGVDCMLVYNWTNQYYISGHYQHMPWYPISHNFVTESPLIIFQDDTEPVFICAYITYKGIKEGTWISDVRPFDRESRGNTYEYIATVLKEKGFDKAKIGIEENCCTISTYQQLSTHLPDAQLKPVSYIFYVLKSVKEDEEIALIKKSVAAGESALQVALDTAKPGVTEMEVQTAMEIEMKRNGILREVETMCQSGIRTANYRAWASEWKKIEENDLVTVDLGGIYKGYGCDMARTWVVGKPTAEQKKVAEDLYKVQNDTFNYIKPGLTYGDVFNFMKDELIKYGYPADKHANPQQQFSIHGLGLGPFHDSPGKGHPETVLTKNMVISVQPSVRFENYSIRFEDDIVITEDGIELLTTKVPKELI